MLLRQLAFSVSLLFFFSSCGETPKKENSKNENTVKKKDTLILSEENDVDSEKNNEQEEVFVLNEENVIDFFFNYAKELKSNKVKLTTTMGSFTVELYDNVPYHKANFIYLARKKYFDSTQFHRVVKDFIIQGGNSDDKRTPKKRREIGRYL